MTTPRTSFTDDLLLDLDRGTALPAHPGGWDADPSLDEGAAGLRGSWAVTPRAWALPSLRRTDAGLEAAAGPLRLGIQLHR